MDAFGCDRLRRTYVTRSITGRRETVALADVSFAVPAGIVFGLLGPNGAGKTTTCRILSTLLLPTGGTAHVLGNDVVRQAGLVRRSIGLILGGDRGLYGRLSGRDNLRYHAALNLLPVHESDARIERLIDLVGLRDAADRLVEGYSRGMRQRLHLARGLVTDPAVLFLDEPTIGLDPLGAQEVRALIPRLVEAGKTILLTTHYMFEADALCDQIAIINHGLLVANGTPTDIKRRFSKVSAVEIRLRAPIAGLADQLGTLSGIVAVQVGSDDGRQTATLQVTGDPRDHIIAALGDAIETYVARDPTLEEAYLSILR